MNRELFVLRHAKSEPAESGQNDFDRTLSRRGCKDIQRIAEWMREHYLYPAIVVASPALRVRETVAAVSEVLEIPAEKIRYDERLYLASLQTILKILTEVPTEYNSVMLVGHNPGLDELVEYVSKESVPLSDSGKLMTTACLAHFKMPVDWAAIDNQAQLLDIVRPRAIK